MTTSSAAAALVSSVELDLLDTFTLSETGGGKQAPSTAPIPAGLAFGTMDDLDYSVISSAQTIENVFSTFLSERSGSIAEEGGDSNNNLLDTDNSTQSTNPQSAPTSSSSQQQPPDPYSNGSMGAALEDHHRHSHQNQHYQHQWPRQESFASINSSTTTEPLPQFQINQPHHHPSGMPRSRPVSIPQPSSYQHQQHHVPMTTSSTTTTAAVAGASGTVSQASSAGSSGSAFLNNILNPAATTTNTGFTIMAHTPPTYIATSYEASHFGKRPRANVRNLFSFFHCGTNIDAFA
jgi:hypothetical protein